MNKFLLSILLSLCSIQYAYCQYSTYYNDGNVSGKIIEDQRIIDYKTRKINDLYFFNNSSQTHSVSGWVKVRYTEFRSGKTDYKEKRFNLTIQAGGKHKVNCYFKPSWSRYSGKYEPVEFFVESTSSNSVANVNTGRNSGKIYFKVYNQSGIAPYYRFRDSIEFLGYFDNGTILTSTGRNFMYGGIQFFEIVLSNGETVYCEGPDLRPQR